MTVPATAALHEAIAAVPDPELPVLTIADLGILRSVELDGDRVTVTITPTYSGCPAIDVIADDITTAARAQGFLYIEVRRELAPAWSSADITAAGRAKLAAAGIAPPDVAGPAPPGELLLQIAVRCPACGSPNTRQTSRFGPAPCMALHVCDACREPFEHVKAI